MKSFFKKLISILTILFILALFYMILPLGIMVAIAVLTAFLDAPTFSYFINVILFVSLYFVFLSIINDIITTKFLVAACKNCGTVFSADIDLCYCAFCKSRIGFFSKKKAKIIRCPNGHGIIPMDKPIEICPACGVKITDAKRLS